MTIELKQHDTATTITETLRKGDAPIDLTDATVVLVLRQHGGAAQRLEPVEIDDDPTTGNVEYQPTDDDVADPGIFDFEWEVTFSNDEVLTVPTHGYNKLKINPDLG